MRTLALRRRRRFVSFACVGVAVLALASSAGAFVPPTCLVDQFGNTYSFTVDKSRSYVYGTLTTGQGCAVRTWPLLGSYVHKTLELTVANPTGGSDHCVAVYKLKGRYPNAAWYYDTGFGGQPFRYSTCSEHRAPLKVSHGGALK